MKEIHNSYKENVASELRALRAKTKYSQKEVADKADIDVMTVTRYENNSVSMQLDMLEKIVSVYGLSLDIFFSNVSANMQNKLSDKPQNDS